MYSENLDLRECIMRRSPIGRVTLRGWDVQSEVQRRRTAHRKASDELTVGELSFRYGGA